MHRTLYRKLLEAHVVRALDEEHVLLFCDLHLMNEYTSPQAFAGLDARGAGVLFPGSHVATVSHVIPTHAVSPRVIHDPVSALQARTFRLNCERHGIALFDTNDPLQGIEHVIAPEHGMIRPGMVVRAATATPRPTARWAPWGSASAPRRSSTCWPRRPWCTGRPATCASASTASCPGAPSPRTWC
jgi:homoaconitase/3-isopropylmalate dehydratase large subunit